MFGMLCTVSNLNIGRLPRRHRLLAVSNRCTATRSIYVLDNQKMIAKIPQTKSSGLGSFPIKIAHFIDKSRIKESALRQSMSIHIHQYMRLHYPEERIKFSILFRKRLNSSSGISLLIFKFNLFIDSHLGSISLTY